ncbi:MAG TPA: site-specific integrase [Caulobacter sp.]|nr:site-specific integrase [Caulobacter sp.]
MAAFGRESRITQAFGRSGQTESPDEFMERMAAEERQVRAWIAEIVRAEGWSLPPEENPVPNPLHQTLYMAVLTAWKAILAKERRWLNNDFADLPTAPPPTRQAAEPPLGRPTSLTLQQAFAAWSGMSAARSARTRQHRTVIDAKLAVRRFVELHGDLPLSEISRRQAREFRDKFAQVPARLPMRLANTPLPRLLEEDLSAYPARTATTINKSLNLLAAIASHAEREGDLDAFPAWKNPFGVQLVIDPQTTGSYEPFSAKDLNRLLSSPVFSRGERPQRGRKEAAKWLPLLAMLHGARRGELVPLRVRDVVADDETGIRYLQIAPELESGRRVKNLGSIRKTPLHPKAVELGFLDYLDRRREAVGPTGLLWDGLDTDSRVTRWTEWFHRYLREAGVDHPRKRFHSFRHTFKRVARDTLDAAVIDALCGHVSGVGGGYGKARDGARKDSGYNLTALAKAMEKIEFRGVDFSVVR